MCTIRCGAAATIVSTTSRPAPVRGGSSTTTSGWADRAGPARRAPNADGPAEGRPTPRPRRPRPASRTPPNRHVRSPRPVGEGGREHSHAAVEIPHVVTRGRCAHSPTTSAIRLGPHRGAACQKPVAARCHSRPPTRSTGRPEPMTTRSARVPDDAARRAVAPRRPGLRRPCATPWPGAISTTVPVAVRIEHHLNLAAGLPRPLGGPAYATGRSAGTPGTSRSRGCGSER